MCIIPSTGEQRCPVQPSADASQIIWQDFPSGGHTLGHGLGLTIGHGLGHGVDILDPTLVHTSQDVLIIFARSSLSATFSIFTQANNTVSKHVLQIATTLLMQLRETYATHVKKNATAMIRCNIPTYPSILVCPSLNNAA